MIKYIAIDKYLEWHNAALADYINKQYQSSKECHVLDLAVASASFAEAFYLIIENMPNEHSS